VPQHLTKHDRTNLRLPTYAGLRAWRFEKDGRELKVRVEGQLVFNNPYPTLSAALDVLEDRERAYVADARLVQLLADCCAPLHATIVPRQPTADIRLRTTVEAVRYRG